MLVQAQCQLWCILIENFLIQVFFKLKNYFNRLNKFVFIDRDTINELDTKIKDIRKKADERVKIL